MQHTNLQKAKIILKIIGRIIREEREKTKNTNIIR